jgi:uncharacterized membrane protein YidH (DUF202 family)
VTVDEDNRLSERGPDGDAEFEPDYRFTLANERTFLAWQRTALGLLAAAVAVVHLVPEASQGRATSSAPCSRSWQPVPLLSGCAGGSRSIAPCAAARHCPASRHLHI